MRKQYATYEDNEGIRPTAFEVETKKAGYGAAFFVRESLDNQGREITPKMLAAIASEVYQREQVFSEYNNSGFLYHYNQKAGVWDEYSLTRPSPQQHEAELQYFQKLPQYELESRYKITLSRTEGERTEQIYKDLAFMDYQQREYRHQFRSVLEKAPEWATEGVAPYSIEDPSQLFAKYEKYKQGIERAEQQELKAQERAAAKEAARIENGHGKIESTNGDLLTFKLTIWNDRTLFLRQLAVSETAQRLFGVPEEMAAAISAYLVPDKRLNGRGVKDGTLYVYDSESQMWNQYKYEVGRFGKIEFEFVQQRYQHQIEKQHSLHLTQTEEKPQQTTFSEKNIKRELWNARMTSIFSPNPEKRAKAQAQADLLKWELKANKEVKKQFEKFETEQKEEIQQTRRR